MGFKRGADDCSARRTTVTSSAAPTALGFVEIDFPALPGWADVWRSALRALASMAIFAVSFHPQLAAGKLAAPNEQNDFSISIRYWEGETADSSASLGMTKGRTALSLNLVVPPTIPMDVVHFSLNLPQASQLLGMTKGRAALPFGLMAAMATSQSLFIPHST